MWKKKIVGIIWLLSLLVLAIPDSATGETILIRAETYLERSSARLSRSGRTSVNIRNIPSGDTVYGSILIIAQVTGTYTSVVFQIDKELEYPMSQINSTDLFQATWNTTQVSPAVHTLYVKAKNLTDKVLASSSAKVVVVSSYQWEMYIEIDYVEGHQPGQAVLDYMQSYWAGHAINVSFMIDDLVSDPTSSDGYISSDDFWAIEKQYNDVWHYDDRSFGGVHPKYTLKEKWMLYGSWDEDSDVGGYTYIKTSRSDALAGNYIFIADAMIEDWEIENYILGDCGEVIVVCHESGHSIGIAMLRRFYERYDSDIYSIMSYMQIQNAKLMAACWYYSKEYWSRANLGYYNLMM